jgi:hypothetical protein
VSIISNTENRSAYIHALSFKQAGHIRGSEFKRKLYSMANDPVRVKRAGGQRLVKGYIFKQAAVGLTFEDAILLGYRHTSAGRSFCMYY